MQTFWENGYCATSISRLVEATHLKPGSLYAAFDSKEGLFLAALDRYAQQSVERLEQALGEARGPLQGIEGFLRGLIAAQYATVPPRGCLLVNTALELGRHNAGIRERVASHLAGIETRLRQALEEAESQGGLAADASPGALAKLLMTTIWGLRVMAGTGADSVQATSERFAGKFVTNAHPNLRKRTKLKFTSLDELGPTDTTIQFVAGELRAMKFTGADFSGDYFPLVAVYVSDALFIPEPGTDWIGAPPAPVTFGAGPVTLTDPIVLELAQ